MDPDPNPNPNPMLSGQVESESESEKNGSDPHHCFKGSIILKSSVSYFNSLGKCDLSLQKLPNIKDSNRLPGVFIAGESITNTNNSTNIRKNLKSVLDMPNGTSRRCLMKKTGHEKSRDTEVSASFSFSFHFVSFRFASDFYVSHRCETSEKITFFRIEAKKISLRFRFISLRSENDGRTLLGHL
jgi:hypothetical protein